MVSTTFTSITGEQQTVTGMYVRKNIHNMLVDTLQQHEKNQRSLFKAQGIKVVDAELQAASKAGPSNAAAQQAAEIMKGAHLFRTHSIHADVFCCTVTSDPTLKSAPLRKPCTPVARLSDQSLTVVYFCRDPSSSMEAKSPATCCRHGEQAIGSPAPCCGTSAEGQFEEALWRCPHQQPHTIRFSH